MFLVTYAVCGGLLLVLFLMLLVASRLKLQSLLRTNHNTGIRDVTSGDDDVTLNPAEQPKTLGNNVQVTGNRDNEDICGETSQSVKFDVSQAGTNTAKADGQVCNGKAEVFVGAAPEAEARGRVEGLVAWRNVMCVAAVCTLCFNILPPLVSFQRARPSTPPPPKKKKKLRPPSTGELAIGTSIFFLSPPHQTSHWVQPLARKSRTKLKHPSNHDWAAPPPQIKIQVKAPQKS